MRGCANGERPRRDVAQWLDYLQLSRQSRMCRCVGAGVGGGGGACHVSFKMHVVAAHTGRGEASGSRECRAHGAWVLKSLSL